MLNTAGLMIRSNGPISSLPRNAPLRRQASGALTLLTAMLLLSACGGSGSATNSPTAIVASTATPAATQAAAPASPTVAATTPASPTNSPPTAAPTATTTVTPLPAAATQAPTATQPPAPTQAAAPSARAVAVAGFAFSPSVLAVPAGSTVTWTWSGDDFHNVSGAAFSSGGPAQSGKFSFTFTAAGTFSYACDVHSAAGMTGTVTVQ